MKALLVFLVLIQTTQPPRPTGKAIVTIERSGSDRVGTSFLYAFKEGINKSSRYTLDWNQYDNSRPLLEIYIVTLDDNSPAQGYSSAISLVVMKYGAQCPEMTTHLLLNVGSQKYEEMAKVAIAEIDDDVEKAQKK